VSPSPAQEPEAKTNEEFPLQRKQGTNTRITTCALHFARAEVKAFESDALQSRTHVSDDESEGEDPLERAVSRTAALPKPVLPVTASPQQARSSLRLLDLATSGSGLGHDLSTISPAKPSYLRRLDNAVTPQEKLEAQKSKLAQMLAHSLHILPRLEPSGYQSVKQAFVAAVARLEEIASGTD